MPPKTIYLFYGEDTYSGYQKARHWQQEFEKKYGDMNVHVFEGEELTTEQFQVAVDSAAFLSDKKLIIVHDFLEDGKEADQKKVAEKLETIEADTVLVFVERNKPDARTGLYKKLKKLGQIEEFLFLIGPKLVKWIQTEITKKGGKIGTNEAEYLAETVGPNLWQMKQEIEKLVLYSSDKAITIDAIEQLTSPNVSASIFKLTDYIGQKRSKESLRTLAALLESGEDIVKVFFMMVRQIRIIIQIRDCLDKKMTAAEITSKMKEHPYVIKTSIVQSKNFTMEQLKQIYKMLLKVDSDLKSGKIKMTAGDTTEFRLALEKLIVELCSK